MAAPIESMETSGVNDKVMCEIEGSVATGFEEYAREEIEEKFKCKATTERGKVSFKIQVQDVKKTLDLSSVDNISVVIKHYQDFPFADTKEGILEQFEKLVPELDWELGLLVWSKFFTFPHPISHKPQEKIENKEANSQNEKPSADEEPESKKLKTFNPLLPTFRATCYRSGGKHLFGSPDGARSFGGAINDYFGWNVKLKESDINVMLIIEDKHVYVALALTRESLHKRNIVQFGPTTLKPTVAYGMLRMCQIQTGEIVCDPMCGGGSLPIEAAINWPNAFHWCGDIYEAAIPRVVENVKFVNEKRTQKDKKPIHVQGFKWDVCNLPLKDNCVDVFVTDLPFGKRSGSKMSNWHLYPRALKEMARVCKPTVGRACLLTHDRKCIVKSFKEVNHLWRRGATLGVNMGGLAAAVFMLHRTSISVYDDIKETDRESKSEKMKESNQ